MSCCRGRGRRAESWLGRAEEPQAGVGLLAPREEEGSTPARPPSSLAAPRKDGAPLRRGVALPISKMAAGEGGGWWGWSRPRGWRGLPAAGARRGGMVARGLRALRGALRAIAAAERRFSTRPARAPAMDYQVRAGGGEGSGSSRRVLPRGGGGWIVRRGHRGAAARRTARWGPGHPTEPGAGGRPAGLPSTGGPFSSRRRASSGVGGSRGRDSDVAPVPCGAAGPPAPPARLPLSRSPGPRRPPLIISPFFPPGTAGAPQTSVPRGGTGVTPARGGTRSDRQGRVPGPRGCLASRGRRRSPG